jgi:hypothetical protein
MKGLLFLLVVCVSSLNAATIAHYKFDNGSLDAPLYEMTDSSANGHHGRVLGKELFELTSDVPAYPGVSGAALDLRGRLDYAVIPHHRDFAPTGSWTIEFFIKVGRSHQDHGGATNIAPGSFYPSVNTNEAYTVLYKQNTNEVTRFGSAWAFHYIPETGHLVFTISRGTSGGQMMVDAADLRASGWHHIAVVYSVGAEYSMHFYHNGFLHQSENIGSAPFAWGDGPIFVGAWAAQDDVYSVKDRNFDGMLDEIRFSDSALDTESFVVNFAPYIFASVPVEANAAFEVEFEAEAGKIYRIERIDPATGGYARIGYRVGEGGLKSFFHRGDAAASDVRVVVDSEIVGPAVPFTIHDAIELRFPTAPQQLYQITSCDTLTCSNQESYESDFVLGDGAKMSYFRRAHDGSRFYRVERY